MILIAGGTGRLGTRVSRGLVQRGLAVRVLTRAPDRAAHLVDDGIEVVRGDVRDRTSLTAAVDGVDLVISAVHGFVGPRGISPRTVDREGNANLVDAAQSVGAGVVLMSTVGAAPDSAMELFRMKHAAEDRARAAGIPATIIRATAFMELWIDLLRQTAGRSGRPLVFGIGDNPVNFVSVDDVAALVVRVVAEGGAPNETLEIGGPQDLTLNDLARAVQAADGRGRPARHIPPPMLRLMANIVGRVSPQAGRQARAALAMDHDDLTFDGSALHRRYPGLPSTSVADVLLTPAIH